jgi:predicted ATPase
VRRSRLAARLASVVPASDRDRVCTFLGELARVPADDPGTPLAAARRDPLMMGDQLRRAWEDWLAAETERRPVVLVLDDLHLGDLSSIKLIDSALRNLRERPLFVLALARPEIELVFPGMWAERGVVTVPLAELSRKASTRLVHEILGDADEGVVERIVRQADGNAFYLEELCRVVHDGAAAELPGTVLAMAQARLEALDAGSRRLLRAASIFGARFPRGGVLTLWGDLEDAATVDRMLAHLVEAELLEPANTEFLGERSYVFRHGLVREAAYAMLTDTDRRLGHRLAAEWLAGAGSADRILLAEHHERGGQPERALEGYHEAAREALQGNDLAAVLARVERGLGCGARGTQLGALLALRAEALRWRAEYSAAQEAAALAMAVLAPGSTEWCSAVMAGLAALMALDAHDRVEELLGRVLAAPPIDPVMRLQTLGKFAVNLYLVGRYERADQLSAHLDAELARTGIRDPLLDARILEQQAFREGARAEQGRALALLRQTASAYLRAGDLRNACMTQNNVGYTFIQLGAYAEAAAHLELALHDAVRMGITYAESMLRQNLAIALGHLGQRDRALSMINAAYEEFRRQNDLHMAAVCRIYVSQLVLAIDPALAEREASAALVWLTSNPPSRALALASMARARVASGATSSALAPAREAYAILESLGGLDEGEFLIRLAFAEALSAAGRAGESGAVVHVACARLDLLASRLTPELSRTFLCEVPEHAALRALLP